MFDHASGRAPEEKSLDRAITMGTDHHEVDLWIVCHQDNLFNGMPNAKAGLCLDTPTRHFLCDLVQILQCFLLRRMDVPWSPSGASRNIIRDPKHVEEPKVCIFPYRNVGGVFEGSIGRLGKIDGDKNHFVQGTAIVLRLLRAILSSCRWFGSGPKRYLVRHRRSLGDEEIRKQLIRVKVECRV